MRCRISRSILDDILSHAAESPSREVCGLLFGSPQEISGHMRCRNVAADPSREFEIDPSQLIAAYRAERSSGPSIVGCYHSHPGGDPTPSARDAMTDANGWAWLIIGARQARLWRAGHDGTWHGRFDPVEMDVVTVAASQ